MFGASQKCCGPRFCTRGKTSRLRHRVGSGSWVAESVVVVVDLQTTDHLRTSTFGGSRKGGRKLKWNWRALDISLMEIGR